MTAHGLSQRRACGLLDMDRTSFRYRSTRGDDAELRARMRALAVERRRFGYRRLRWLLEREGVRMNHKRFRRLYAEEKLQVQRRRGRRRAIGVRAPLVLPQGPNQRWSLDFVADQLTTGRRFRILTVVDDFTKESLATVPDTSITGRRLVAELNRIVERRGKPLSIVSDNVLTWQSMGKARQQISLRRCVPVAGCRNKNQVASTVQGCALNHSKPRIRANVAVLTVLKTRYATKWKARTLSTGSQGELCPHGSVRAKSFHLAPADRRTAGSRLRSGRSHARRAPSWRRRP